MFRCGSVVFLIVLIVGYLDYRVQGPHLSETYRDNHSVPVQSPKGMDFYYAFRYSTALRADIVRAVRAPAGERPAVVNRSVYPPAFMLAIMPFTFMTDIHAYQTYSVVLLVFLFAAIVASLREKDSGAGVRSGFRDTLVLAVAITAVLLQAYPVSFALERGNSDIVAAAFAAFAVLAIVRDSMMLAAAALSISVNVKLYPAILVVLLFRRFRWKGTLWCAAFTSAQLLVLGTGGAYDLSRRLTDLTGRPYVWPGNHSLWSFIRTLGQEGFIDPALHVVVHRVGLAALGAVLAASALRALSVRRGPLSPVDVGVCGMCFALMSLVPATSNDYQLVVQVVPFLLLLSRSWDELFTSKRAACVTTAVVAAAMGFLFVPLYTVFPLRTAGLTSPVLAMKTPALLVAFLGYAWLAIFGLPDTCRRSGARETATG